MSQLEDWSMAQRRSVMQGTLKRLHVYCKDVAGPQVRADRPEVPPQQQLSLCTNRSLSLLRIPVSYLSMESGNDSAHIRPISQASEGAGPAFVVQILLLAQGSPTGSVPTPPWLVAIGVKGAESG